MQIKASIYGKTIMIPSEPECGLVGCAILASIALGDASDLASAASRLVSYEREVLPDPAQQELYSQMQSVFDRLYVTARAFYDDLDALDQKLA